MRKVKRFFCIFGFLLCVIFVLWLCDSSFISVSADIEPQAVELSIEQTFALFGYQFDGVGYTSSNGTSRIPFYYVCRSSELRDLQHLSFWNYYSYGQAVDQLVSDFNGQEFLLYACDASLLNDDSHHLFTAYVPFSLNIENIQFYRQRFWYSIQSSGSKAVYASSLDSHRSTAELYSTVSSAAYQQKTEIYSALNEPGNSTDLFGFPLMWSNLRSNGSQYMLGAGIDLYYRPFDSNNQPINFNVSGIDFYFKNIQSYHVPSTISDWLGASYEGSNPLLDRLLNKDCFFLYIGQPILSDGFDIPSTEPEIPDYTEQIDNINTNTATISANLSAILAKLNQIYAAMTAAEQTPTLQDPETIGFDSRTKSEIMTGLRGASDMLDSQSIPEAAGNVAQGVWGASDSIFSSVPGLMSVYMFIFIGGIVSWVIFGKRGG